MPEEVVLEKPATDKVTFDPFDGSETPIEVAKKEVIEEKKEGEKFVAEEKAPEVKPEVKTDDEEIFDEDMYIKEKFGFDNAEVAKAEFEKLKNKKEFEFTNEQSRQIASLINEGKTDELYNFLDRQTRYKKLTEGTVTKDNAPEIIKAAMLEKYKGLTPEQVNYKFNKQFSVPKEPVRSDDEMDEDFEARKNEWKEQVENVQMDLIIEANLSRPELEKLKAELKLPQISKAEPVKELSPEELVKVQEGRDLFLNDASEAVKKFSGFNVTYKDKDVEIQSTYNLSEQEKKDVMAKVKTLVENNYDVNVIFGKRWVKGDTFDFNQMAKDLASLDSEDKRSQKFVSDAAAKARIYYMKDKHNIDLGSGGNGELQLEDKERQKKNEDAIWSN